MLLERETVMSTLKAFGISCGIVLGVAVCVAAFSLVCLWKPWVFFVSFAIAAVTLCTFILRGK